MPLGDSTGWASRYDRRQELRNCTREYKPCIASDCLRGVCSRNHDEEGITFESVGLAVSLCDAGFEIAASFFAGHHSSDAMERTPPAAISPIYGISAGDA